MGTEPAESKWLIGLLSAASGSAADAAEKMYVGRLLVAATGAPIRLTGTSSFISPSRLIIAMPAAVAARSRRSCTVLNATAHAGGTDLGWRAPARSAPFGYDGVGLFAPLERAVVAMALKLRIVQSGHLSFYLSLIGALLVVILFIAFL